MRPSHWLLAGLVALAAGCLGLVGDKPPADRDFDGVANELDCAPDDPGRWQPLPAYVDQDQDGYGAGAQGTVCAGSSLSNGYSAVGTDCDDADYDAWQLMVRYADADHDGVGAGEAIPVCAGSYTPYGYAESGGDCAPDDGARWQELGYLYRDGDLDGYTVPFAGTICSGANLPAGHQMFANGLDCDDADAAAFVSVEAYADADSDGHGVGTAVTFCTGGALPPGYATSAGDCAPADGARWQELAYSFVDLDRDGYSVAELGLICSGTWLPTGYRTTPSDLGNDCDDAAVALHTLRLGYLDADADGYGAAATGQFVCSGDTLPAGWIADGTDCAPTDPLRWRPYAYTFRDADGDGATVPETGSLCVGTNVPAGYGGTSSYPSDCNDADPTVFYPMTGYADADLDGFGVPPLVSVCTARTLPAGYSTKSTDCAPADPTLWRPLAFANVDRDGDGYTTREAGPFCFGAALPAPYVEKAVGNDCSDSDPALYRWVILYEDKDGDGVGAPPRWIPCLGATVPAGWSIFGHDADDADPGVVTSAGDELLFTILD